MPLGSAGSGRLSARDLALVAVFAALIAALGMPGTFYPFGSQVPITGQTLGVMLAGSILGARRGASAVLVFLTLVAAGLPVLAGGRGGLGVFIGASAGFLIGWVPGAWVIGRLVEMGRVRFTTGWVALANVVGGIVVVYLCGIPVMAHIAHLSIPAAVVAVWVYLPGDVIKVAVATTVARGVHRGWGIPAREHATRPKAGAVER